MNVPSLMEKKRIFCEREKQHKKPSLWVLLLAGITISSVNTKKQMQCIAKQPGFRMSFSSTNFCMCSSIASYEKFPCKTACSFFAFDLHSLALVCIEQSAAENLFQECIRFHAVRSQTDGHKNRQNWNKSKSRNEQTILWFYGCSYSLARSIEEK